MTWGTLVGAAAHSALNAETTSLRPPLGARGPPAGEDRGMVRIGAVVMNVKDARRASEFWRHALGYGYRDGGYDDDATPVLVPQHGTGPVIALDESDRTHFDLHTDSAGEQYAEVERLISLGATRVEWRYPENARFVVLADTEGNLFCVISTGRD